MFSSDSEDEGKGERIKMKDNVVNDVAEESAALKEIARMDAVLRSKQVEKEKATVERTRMEKDSLSLLTDLVNSDISGAFKINIQTFLKFICDSDSCEETVEEEEEEEKKKDVALDDGYEYGVDSFKKKKKTPENIERIKKIDRVEKNIQLAKCGQGVLSVTDQEREKIDRLLQDAEFVDFSPDETEKVVLKDINDRIQILQKKSGKDPADVGELNVKERKLGESALKQIDATLEELRSGTEREVHPLSDEQMEALIKKTTAEIPWPDMPPETLARLVAKTKKSIPKFMYKWPENDLGVT